jgi:glycerophosphoryl diester phosphodiesterase
VTDNNFLSEITGLSADTNYVYRAYMETENGDIIYGEASTFTTAQDDFEPNPDPIDVTELEDLVETAKAISNEDGSYTESSYQALQEAITTAEAALELIETEEALNAVVTALQGAIDGLEAIEPNQMEEHGYRVETVAHRGGAGHAPENTMSAFHNAFEMKADYLELDVHVSKDGELVVIHDPTVDRTTNGTGYVKDLTLEELKNLDAGSSFAPEFAGEKIPTLSEVLDEFRGKIGILIEIKAPLLYPDIEEKIADELIKRNMHKPKNEKIIVQGFYHPSVKEFHELLPEVPVGVLTQSNDELTDEALEDYRTYADYVNLVLGTVTPELIERIHGVGMKTMAWTETGTGPTFA